MRNSGSNRSGRNSGGRGFASLDQQSQREISSRSGRASHGRRGDETTNRYEDEDNYQGDVYSHHNRDENINDSRHSGMSTHRGGQGERGWFSDSETSQRGWEDRREGNRNTGSYGSWDDRRGSNNRQDERENFGTYQSRSETSQWNRENRGEENRNHGGSYHSDTGRRNNHRDQGERGRSEDSRRYVETSDRGWESRDGGNRNRGGGSDSNNDVGRRQSAHSRRGERTSFGDDERYSEAAKRRSEHRSGGTTRSRAQGGVRSTSVNRSGSQKGHRTGKGSGRGFASMDPEQVREIARMGGRAAHRAGTAHEFDSAEARRAGQKGGRARSKH